ncbi:MAG: SHOCT domain-containing protein [Ruminococcaceae bacterium]|nr:SHOCT domain-containing protein [Oscillospiraceae bacterium]
MGSVYVRKNILNKYKKLLDMCIITQEEFDENKKPLLNL